MKKVILFGLAVCGITCAAAASAVTFNEEFSTNPLSRGWQVFGDTNCFQWNLTNQNLEVTWDSRRSNSYFFRPLGTVLAKDDDFCLAFDLRLSDIVSGIVPDKLGPFEIAVGFLNLATATNATFHRGDPHNLVEFDYFPAGFYAEWGISVDPTVSPIFFDQVNSTNAVGSFAYPLELTTNDWFHIMLTYTASNQTLVTTLLRNGQPYGTVDDAVLTSQPMFTDFRVNAVSISSYAGDAYSSVLAHGKVDNLSLTVPAPPITGITGGFTNQHWQVCFNSQPHWLYTLEQGGDFNSWKPVSSIVAGTGLPLSLVDTNAPALGCGFYRVQARRQ